MRVCLECHILVESGSRCSSCQLDRDRIRFAQPLQREIRSRARSRARDLRGRDQSRARRSEERRVTIAGRSTPNWAWDVP